MDTHVVNIYIHGIRVIMSQNQVIRRTTKNRRGTVSIIIPTKFRDECGLNEATDVIIEKKDSGLFVKKLRTDKDE